MSQEPVPSPYKQKERDRQCLPAFLTDQQGPLKDSWKEAPQTQPKEGAQKGHHPEHISQEFPKTQLPKPSTGPSARTLMVEVRGPQGSPVPWGHLNS